MAKSDGSFDWEEFDAAFYEFTLTHLRRLSKAFPSQTAYQVHIHCNAYDGEVYPYLQVRPQTDEAQRIRIPTAHRPWATRSDLALEYTLDGWEQLELEPSPRQASVRRFTKAAEQYCQWLQACSDDDDDDDEVQRLTTEFMHRACLVALRLEKNTGFEFVRKEPGCVLFVEDHDEPESHSWKRLIKARTEVAPPWKKGSAAWPISGRQPEIAAAIFVLAMEYYDRNQLRQAASLLREAIACLPELQGTPAHRVEGTNVRLPIPENQAWARAYLAVAGSGDWDEATTRRALTTALRLDPTLPDAYFLKAKLRAGGPEPARILDSAAKDLDRAIALDGGNPEYFALRAGLRPYHPFWEQALADYTRAHELDPFNQRWLQERAEVHEQLRDYEAAIRDYSRIFELRHSVPDEDTQDTIRGRAKCLRKVGRIQEAIQDWNRLIKYEKNAEYFRQRAACFRRLGNKERAAKDEQTAQKIKRHEKEEDARIFG